MNQKELDEIKAAVQKKYNIRMMIDAVANAMLCVAIGSIAQSTFNAPSWTCFVLAVPVIVLRLMHHNKVYHGLMEALKTVK